MSFLHIPKESVVYRSDNALGKLTFLYSLNFLNRRVHLMCVVKHLKKVSTCDIEVDIFATTILNAKSNFDSTEQYSNPGIRSLWIDERLRRANYPFDPNEKVGSRSRYLVFILF
jgi:hypothetical protein